MRIVMVAGEASGDLLASHLILALKEHFPDAEFMGVGGPKMQATGFTVWWPTEALAVNGITDVLWRYRELSGLRKSVLAHVQENPPDLFIGVDAPEFNLWIEERLRKSGTKTVHYVSPSIWGWRKNRVHGIKRAVDLVLCLFPFEKPLYDKESVPAAYVGHPLADSFTLSPDREAARATLQLKQTDTFIAMLPGSRLGEVSRLAQCYVETAELLHQRDPSLRFIVPLVTRRTFECFEQAAKGAIARGVPIKLVVGHSDLVMTAANIVLVASGTATLEAALLKRPMVIAYKLSGLTYWLGKRLVVLPYIGLPNILAGEFLVPEFIQEKATPTALADALQAWLADTDRYNATVERFTQIHLSLRQNNAQKAAQAIINLLMPEESTSEKQNANY